MPVLPPRALPPLSLSSDAIPEPLDKLPLLSSPEDSASTSKREAPLDWASHRRPSPFNEDDNAKRNLPPVSLSSDALLKPIDDLPILNDPEPSSTSKRAALLTVDSDKLIKAIDSLDGGSELESKREAEPLLSLDSDKILGALPVEKLPLLSDPESSSSTSRRAESDPPLINLSSSGLLENLPVHKLQLNPLQSSTSKREQPPPIVQVNTLQFLDKLGKLLHPSSASRRDEPVSDEPSVPELPTGNAPPLVAVNPGKVIDKLGDDLSSKLNLNSLHPSKRADQADQPPIVQVNSLQFLDKLGKLNLDPFHPSTMRRGLLPRQNSVAIPTQYQGINSGPAPGAVAGIVLGAVAGFLLIVWVLWLISNGGGVLRSSRYTEDDIVVSRHRSRSPGTRRSHRSRRTEMTSRSPPRRERVVRQERIVRDRSIPPPRETSRLRETVIMDEHIRPERRVDGDDIVEVIEEHSSVGVPPPRRKTRRSSGYRSVDPDIYAGGDYPQHRV